MKALSETTGMIIITIIGGAAIISLGYFFCRTMVNTVKEHNNKMRD